MSMSAMPIMGDIGQSIGGSLGGGFGLGLPMEPGQNPVADQTQQMANNPIYGQQSPFQPQQNRNVGIGFGPAPIDSGMGGGKSFGGGMLPPNFGIGLPMEPYQPNPLEGSPIADIGGGGLPNPIAGMPNIGAGGQLIGGPAGKPILGPGQQMPLPMMPPGGSVGQQQMPLPMMPPGGSVGQQQMPVGRPLQGKLPGSNIPYTIGDEPIPPISGARNIGQIAGGPVGKPITNQPQPFRGGLKPAPRNYRPPQRGGNLRSFIGR